MTDEDLREDDEGEEEEETPPAPSPPVANGKPKKRSLSDTKTTGVGRGGPRGTEPPEHPFTSRDPEELWSQIVAWLPSKNRTPSDISIAVIRVDPPAGGMSPVPIGFPFDGGAVAGSETMSAADAFLRYIITYYHLPTIPATAAGGRYLIRFQWKVMNRTLAQGYLNLPDKTTTINMINANNRAQAAAIGTEPDTGMGAPFQPARRPTQVAMEAHQYPPPPPYGIAGWPMPQQPPSGMDPSAMMGFMQEMWRETLAAQRENRQPVMPAMPQPGVAAQVVNEDVIVAKVLMALRQAGIGNPSPATPAAAAVAAPPPVAVEANKTVGGLAGMVEKMVGGILESVVKNVGANVERGIKQSMGVGAPPAEEAAEEVPQEPPKPEDSIPWETQPVGINWNDGRPVVYAKNKETGDIDLTGILMANPIVGEKVMGVAGGLAEAIQEGIKSWATKGQVGAGKPALPAAAPQVVTDIPQGTKDGTPPADGGWRAP